MSNKDFLKGFGLAVGLAVAAGAAIYVGKKALEYIADKNEYNEEDYCGCDCGGANYIDAPQLDDDDFECDGSCDECVDSDDCECATCLEQDCDHCPADMEEGYWDEDTKEAQVSDTQESSQPQTDESSEQE